MKKEILARFIGLILIIGGLIYSYLIDQKFNMDIIMFAPFMIFFSLSPAKTQKGLDIFFILLAVSIYVFHFIDPDQNYPYHKDFIFFSGLFTILFGTYKFILGKDK
ncbi:hypothetical protein [Methanolapillus ohkumae]|uniref:Uncharacterized protein n=1 Tax=Methanolapillus ohkumae TaxID=3028298 RepID=A0AA96V8L4_9EURY|nr:hypothetical protein MsAm2_14330 [Methanosarcinaceae archaeon Am2]